MIYTNAVFGMASGTLEKAAELVLSRIWNLDHRPGTTRYRHIMYVERQAVIDFQTLGYLTRLSSPVQGHRAI